MAILFVGTFLCWLHSDITVLKEPHGKVHCSEDKGKALEMTLPIFPSTEESVIASWSHTSLLRGQDIKMLSWDFFETLKSLSLWPDLEIIRMMTKFSMWRMLGWAKKTMKTMSLQKIRICFVVLSCLIFKHKYATLKFHLNLSTDKKLNTKFEYLF